MENLIVALIVGAAFVAAAVSVYRRSGLGRKKPDCGCGSGGACRSRKGDKP